MRRRRHSRRAKVRYRPRIAATPHLEGGAAQAASLDWLRHLNNGRATVDVVTRLAAFIIALLLAIDAFAAARTETLRVDGHSRVSRWRRDDDYRLHFAGGRVDSCDVGWSAFNALRDGDEVAVDTSRVFKSCAGIRRGDEVIVRASLHKWFLLIPIAALLAAAFGWIQFERSDGDDRRWWFGS